MPASTTANPFAKLDRIALSFSGGGFRAAAYALGVLSFLNKLKMGEGTLLDRVAFSSSASGGTITNAYYSFCRVENKPFDDFYQELLGTLQGQKMMQATLDTLTDETQWTPSGTKNRNLVNAFSKMIDAQLFKGATFGLIENNLNGKFSVCFNTVELYRGLTFRFQLDNATNSREKTGNARIFLNRKLPHYQKIKLADITTASSAFPAGFEPIMFPNDFTYEKSLRNETLKLSDMHNAVSVSPFGGKRSFFNKPFGLMDGGIRDNQALDSAILADEREKNGFDLIAVNDVASYFTDAFEEPALYNNPTLKWLDRSLEDELTKVQKLYRKIGSWLTAGLIGSFVLLVVALLLIFLSPAVVLKSLGYVLSGIGLTGALASGVLRNLKKTKLDKFVPDDEPLTVLKELMGKAPGAEKFSPQVISLLVSYLAKLKIKQLIKMLTARGTSVLMIALGINLKNSRDLTYRVWFSRKRFTDKRVYNVVYELSSHNKDQREYRIMKKDRKFFTPLQQDILLKGTEAMHAPAEAARTMGTTLWFDNSHTGKLDDLIACGQFTMCSNLLEHLMKLETKGRIDPSDTMIKELREQLEEHWVGFKKDPYRMVKDKLI